MNDKILFLNDSPYKNGLHSGEYFKENLGTKYISNIIFSSIDKIKQDAALPLFKILEHDYPKYYEEVVGKANGMGIEPIAYFTFLCPEISDIGLEHCTTIICKDELGRYMISHNEDDDYIEGNFCLSKVWIDDNNWFVTNDMFNMPFGNGISWNSYGIIKTINYCHDDNIEICNLPRYFTQRHISEADSIDDIICRCNNMKPASGFHINAIDTNKNIAASIEVYNDNISVVYIDDYYIHTNHFIHGSHKDNPQTDSGSNSIFRLRKCQELLKNKSFNEITRILQYRSDDDTFEKSILQNKSDPYMTLFNFSYNPSDKDMILFTDYMNRKTVKLDYDIYKKDKNSMV